MPSSTEKKGEPVAPLDDAVVEAPCAVLVLLDWVEAVANDCDVMPLILMSLLQISAIRTIHTDKQIKCQYAAREAVRCLKHIHGR
jgi:hypothetical protein